MSVCLITVAAAITIMPVQPPQPRTLLERIEPWRYPDAEMGQSVMQDGAMQNAAGERTTVSIHCHTSFRTPDAADVVLAYYQQRLAERPADKPDVTGLPTDRGRAVHTVTSPAGQTPIVHLLNIYEPRITTTLVITAGKQTQISWSQFEQYDLAALRSQAP